MREIVRLFARGYWRGFRSWLPYLVGVAWIVVLARWFG